MNDLRDRRSVPRRCNSGRSAAVSWISVLIHSQITLRKRRLQLKNTQSRFSVFSPARAVRRSRRPSNCTATDAHGVPHESDGRVLRVSGEDVSALICTNG